MSARTFRAFAAGASAYKAYLDSPHGRLRREVIWQQLSAFMEGAWGGEARPLRIFDVGCGTGALSLRLAARGHAVVLLDPADEMLGLAQENARALQPPPGIPPRFLRGSLEEAPDLCGEDACDLLLCHTLLEYLPNPRSALVSLSTLLSPGGFVSLVALNHWQEPLRLGIRDGKLDEARSALAADPSRDSLFGLPRSGMVAAELLPDLEAVGIHVVAHEGVCVFADYLPAATLEDPSASSTLLRLELEAGGRSPFREVARYLHLWGRRG